MITEETIKKPKIRLATVFSGIGAIEQALKRANINFDIVFACDNDKFVKSSYFANYDIDENRWYDDVFDIDGKKYQDSIDLFVGGSPCQSFSMVGKRDLEDERGLLVHQFIRLIKETKPNTFIFENVKGLLSHDSGKTWELLLKKFQSLGYHIKYDILNAKDYGIPQNRQRLFVVGFLEKNQFVFPSPIPLNIVMRDLLESQNTLRYFLPEKGVKFVSDKKNIQKRYTQIDGKIALCQKANQQYNWHGDFVTSNIEKYYLSEKIKKYVLCSGTANYKTTTETDLDIARPLLSTMTKMHRAGVDNYITNGERIRKLTPRECLRLMGFPDTFRIVVSDTQAYKQAGNSIVVDVLIHILDSIFSSQKNKKIKWNIKSLPTSKSKLLTVS